LYSHNTAKATVIRPTLLGGGGEETSKLFQCNSTKSQVSKLQVYSSLTVLNVVFLGLMQQMSGCSSILMFLLSILYGSFGNT
jgi:hypothetical protein